MFPGFYGAISSKKGCSRVSVRKVLAGSGGWFQVLPSSFPGHVNGRTLLYIGSILSRNLNTWRARLVSLSNHPRHIVHAHAPYSVGLWRSPSLRAKQPCHADVGLCDGGHLWLRQSSAAMSCRRWLVRWRASMAAAYHCHPSYHENPTLHIGVS